MINDVELIKKIANRDPAAFDIFYDQYARLVFSLCWRILGDEADAEEVTQEVFVQIWKTADRFDPDRGSVRTWLFTIARSRSLDRWGSRKVVQDRMDQSNLLSLEEIPGQSDLEDVTVLRHYVINALSKLTDKQRTALELLYYRGLTHEEIALRLDEPVGTIKSRLHSALIQLRSALSSTKRKKRDKS